MPATAKDDDLTDNASSRRMRKRELDRRCQRVARERTKNRIAYLEGLVDDFKGSDSSGQVAALMKQLSDVAKERDALARTLQGIQNSIQTHHSLIKREARATPDENPANSPSQANDNLDSIDDEATADSNDNFASHGGQDASRNPESLDMKLRQKSESIRDETPLRMQRRGLPIEMPTVHSLDSGQAFINEHAAKNDILQDPVIPRAGVGCECSLGPSADGKRAVNIWRFANEVLVKPARTNPDLERFEDMMEEDVPVRALIEGWPAVERIYGPVLPLSWRRLRRIDEVIFGACNVQERLAALRVMHRLMRFHANRQKLPSFPAWYLERPSQTIAHSHAIDYLAWPGLRERFVFYQHNYCSNEFWRLFCKSFRILWPFEFRDCYTRNLETCRYQVSASFDERLGDINCWTMSHDIFKRWPEFYSDIPVYDSIPSSVSNRMTRLQPPAPRALVQGVADDGRFQERREEACPMLLEQWNTSSLFNTVPTKGVEFGGTQYLDYSGFGHTF